MRHNRRTKKFGRTGSERKALLEGLVGSLMTYQQIKTTVQKAKEAKRLADHVITLGKTNTLAAKRQDHQLTSKLFNESAPRFKNRQGGYTRILQLDRRKGDGASLALLELTEKEIKIKEVKKTKKKAAEDKAHEGHDHSHEGHAHDAEHKKPETKKDSKQQPGFFKNIGKFFRNKGGS